MIIGLNIIKDRKTLLRKQEILSFMTEFSRIKRTTIWESFLRNMQIRFLLQKEMSTTYPELSNDQSTNIYGLTFESRMGIDTEMREKILFVRNRMQPMIRNER